MRNAIITYFLPTFLINILAIASLTVWLVAFEKLDILVSNNLISKVEEFKLDKEVEEAKNNQNGYIYFEVTWRDIDTYTQEWANEEILLESNILSRKIERRE